MSKELLMLIAGAIGSGAAYIFGGLDAAFIALAVFMVLDMATGLIVAGVFKKSGKTENGALNSNAGFKGLCKKVVILLIVAAAVQLDIILGTAFIRDGVIIAFCANEVISLTENAGLMGIPIPAVIVKAIEILNKKSEESGNE